MIINRQYLYDLEYVRSEFESLYHKYKMNNPDTDFSDMENKLLLLSGCITHIHQLHEHIWKQEKKEMMQDFTNQKLIAEILILKNNNGKSKI